ncbi:phospholipase-like protein [Tanacetum coccineum]
MMGEVDIKTLTIEQYLRLTQGNQAPGMVKPKFRMQEKDIEDMTIFEYMDSFYHNKIHELLEEDINYVSEDESETGDQRLINHPSGDKTFTSKPRLEDEELSTDDDLDDWLKTEMERRMCGHDKEGEEDALIDILKSLFDECKAVYTNKCDQIETYSSKTNEVQGVSFVQEDDIHNEEGGISRTLPCQLPPKELNPGSFTLPYTIGSLNLYVMEDLGASVNIMPRSIFKHLRLANLKETNMLVVTANMTEMDPLRVVENVLVKINKFLFPSDFMIMDMLGEPNETMILGRAFLATIHAHIDVFKREISLGFREDRIYLIWMEMFQRTLFCDDESIETIDSSEDMQEPEVEHKEVRYGNKTIDDTTRERRYYEWVAQNSEFKDHDSSHEATVYDNPCEYHHEYTCSHIPQRYKDMLKPRESSFNEGYTNNMTPIVGTSQNLTLKELERRGMPWMMYGKKCEKFHEGTSYPWHDEGFEEEERWEFGIEKTDYEPPFVDIGTFEIKRYSFNEGRSFICITKQFDDALPLGRVNGSRFVGMIRKEMDEEGGTIRKTFSQLGRGIRDHTNSYSCGIKVSVWA